MYAVVAPGLCTVYSNWKDVERVSKLYTYPKWKKFSNEEEALQWLKRNAYGRNELGATHYGNTFKSLYIDAKYKILSDSVCYVLDCSRVGTLRFNVPNALIEYKGNIVNIRLNNIKLSNTSIAGHMSAIYNMLNIISENFDVDIHVEYYSIFYALVNYSNGLNKYVVLVQNSIRDRLSEVAISWDKT